MSDNNAMELESLDAELPEEILNMSTADLEARTRLLDNEVSSRVFLWLRLKIVLLDSHHEIRTGQTEPRAAGSEWDHQGQREEDQTEQDPALPGLQHHRGILTNQKTAFTNIDQSEDSIY